MIREVLGLSLVALVVSFIAPSAFGQVTNNELRAELLEMVARDQRSRENCAKERADDQMRCYVKIAQEIDAPHTKRLEEILNKSGFPTVKAVGIDGVKAYLLILQHSDSIQLRLRSRQGVERLWKEKVLSPSEYTGFVDRLLVKQGKPQIYGSNFETSEGKLVMSRTRDLKTLDQRRKKVGLPSITEYAEMLRKAYNLEVVVPELR